MISRLKAFAHEIQTELGKVSWTNRQQLIESTKVVLMSVALMALFIWICDGILTFIMRWVLR